MLGKISGRYRFRQNRKITKNLLLLALAMSHFSGFGALFVQIGPNMGHDHYTIWGSTLRGQIWFNPSPYYPTSYPTRPLKKIHYVHVKQGAKNKKKTKVEHFCDKTFPLSHYLFPTRPLHYPTSYPTRPLKKISPCCSNRIRGKN